jgi:hypothetical protein
MPCCVRMGQSIVRCSGYYSCVLIVFDPMITFGTDAILRMLTQYNKPQYFITAQVRAYSSSLKRKLDPNYLRATDEGKFRLPSFQSKLRDQRPLERRGGVCNSRCMLHAALHYQAACHLELCAEPSVQQAHQSHAACVLHAHLSWHSDTPVSRSS